jgi:hypothetical protein
MRLAVAAGCCGLLLAVPATAQESQSWRLRRIESKLDEVTATLSRLEDTPSDPYDQWPAGLLGVYVILRESRGFVKGRRSDR